LHKRSFSLGKNDLKHSLIRKNGFTILSNWTITQLMILYPLLYAPTLI
jgi:hypothetical protein